MHIRGALNKEVDGLIRTTYKPRDLYDLIGRGADVNAKYDGSTLLHLAILKERKLINDLLTLGADPNIKNDAGASAVQTLIQTKFSNNELIMLLKHGADINEQFVGGNTLLHLAAKHRLGLISILLELKADPTIRNDAGKTYLDELTSKKASFLFHDKTIALRMQEHEKLREDQTSILNCNL
jgi:ankyrin repeat protein